MTTLELPGRLARDLLLAATCLVLARPISALGPVVLLVLGLTLDNSTFLIVPAIWAAIGMVSAVLSRRPLPGRAIRPGDEPALVSVIQRVADKVGYGSPLLVRVVPEPVAGLSATRSRGVRSSVLLLGWPLIRFLSADQLAAVVAHELAHADHVRRGGTRLLLGARGQLVDSVDARIGFPVALKAHVLVATQPRLWHEELHADAEAAKVVGTGALRSSLEEIEAIDALWWSVVDKVVRAMGEEGAYPVDLYNVLADARLDPIARDVAARAQGFRTALDLPGSSSHPPNEIRFRTLPALPPAEGWGDHPVEFRDRAAVEQWCARAVCTDAEDDDLNPEQGLVWKPARQSPLRENARAELMRATGASTWPEALNRAIEQIVRDPEALGSRLNANVGRASARNRTAVSLNSACRGVWAVLTAGLLDRGWRKASRWTAEVLVDPDGQQIDVREAVESAARAHDSSTLATLVAVAAEGMT